MDKHISTTSQDNKTIKNNSWNQGGFNNNQQTQCNTYRQPQIKPEPIKIDESIQAQNRASKGYYQSCNKYQNNNNSQNKWDQTKTFGPKTLSKAKPKIKGYQLELLTNRPTRR